MHLGWIFCRRLIGFFLSLGVLGWAVPHSEAAPNKPLVTKQVTSKPVAPPPPRSALLTTEAWQRAPLTRVTPEEIDRLVAKELEADQITPAPRTSDEQFLRRVMLDLTGELPAPADVTDFVADSDARKRAKLVDKLLASEAYAKHWARFWHDVVVARLTDRRGLLTAQAFETWMQQQFQKNRGWGEITKDILTATGEMRIDQPNSNGALFFLSSHRGADAANEQAAEVSRVFLGIQIQCAQCHDHPFDQWKRVQFHELAAYFSRLRQQPIREENRIVGFRMISTPRGEHEMPGKDDPKKTLVTNPRFLDGHTPGANKTDIERRKSLASDLVDPKNYWFAAAYVNRIWGQLMGQSFYQPVDDMGPKREAVFPTVLTRLTGAFRGTRCNMKDLFRAILNSETYQRQIRLGETTDQHLHFAAAYPTRLRADALWDALTNVLGTLGDNRLADRRPGAAFPGRQGPGGLEGMFKQEFAFDPSLKPDEVEGSIPQALLLMNNPVVHQRIQAKGNNLLARVLKTYPQDDDAIRMIYLWTLARKPTDRELKKSQSYIAKIGNRTDAFEDLLWALLNSTEFQTKR